MYKHTVTTECERGVTQYRLAFTLDGREVKAIYFNAHHPGTQRNIQEEIVAFYKISVPTFEQKLKRLK
jgi:hypothetical protein